MLHGRWGFGLLTRSVNVAETAKTANRMAMREETTAQPTRGAERRSRLRLLAESGADARGETDLTLESAATS